MWRRAWKVISGQGQHVSGTGLLLRAVVILGVGLLGGVVAALVRNPDDNPGLLARHGHLAEAEAAGWARLATEDFTLGDVDTYLQVHGKTLLHARLSPLLDPSASPPVPPRDDAEIDARLGAAHLTAAQKTLAAFMHAAVHDRVTEQQLADVTALADATPPAPWSNRLLGKHAVLHGQLSDAAAHFEREAREVPDHSGDMEHAVDAWEALKAWDVLQQKVTDPSVAVHVSAHRKVSLALRRRDWAEAARHFPEAIRPNFTAGSLALVVLAGLMWGWFFARLGRWADQPLQRAGLGVLAVALGVASVAPTLAGLFVMDDVLGIRPDGTPVRDAFHYVFSVGLREELSKALAAAVLLPVLWKRNSRLEALVVGSLVGLGFAVEENLGYLERGGAAAALGRFLTANPFHCFATGLITLALFDARRGGARGVEHALNVFATVVLIHGGYDFMLTSTVVDGLSYFAMAAFFLLVRRYLDEVNQVRRGTPLLPVFVNAIAVVAAAGFIHGAYEHGLAVAAVGLVGGLLGDAILVYAFVQELDRL